MCVYIYICVYVCVCVCLKHACVCSSFPPPCFCVSCLSKNMHMWSCLYPGTCLCQCLCGVVWSHAPVCVLLRSTSVFASQGEFTQQEVLQSTITCPLTSFSIVLDAHTCYMPMTQTGRRRLCHLRKSRQSQTPVGLGAQALGHRQHHPHRGMDLDLHHHGCPTSAFMGEGLIWGCWGFFSWVSGVVDCCFCSGDSWSTTGNARSNRSPRCS